jgi:hypothetical protein
MSGVSGVYGCIGSLNEVPRINNVLLARSDRMNWERDPLWRMRHALIGLSLATLLSMFIAALVGRWIGELLDGGYELSSLVYLGLLAYVVAGAGMLLVRVAAQDTRPLAAGRLLRWLLAIWLWPALLAAGKKRDAANQETEE